jgi:hypothetical protein
MKSEGLRMVKSYTFEVGYELDQLKGMNFSITKQFPRIMNYLHDTMIKVQQAQQFQFNEVTNILLQFQSSSLCQIQTFLNDSGF